MDPPDFAIMIFIVSSALLEDGTEVPYKDCGIRVCPLVKVEGNIYKCPAQPTQKPSNDFKIPSNDIAGPSDNVLDTDESNVDRKSFISCNFENYMCIS